MRHSKLIEELGGGTALAEALLKAPGGGPVDREAIYKWIKLDRIPWRWRAPVAAIARAQGKPIPTDFFPGMTSETSRRSRQTTP
jgi:hypothetical protein